MTKSILAYFKSENDAESARANLQKLRVSDVFVDELPETEHKIEFVPILPLGSASTGTGIAGAGALGAGAIGIGENSLNDEEDNHVTHLLEGQVDEEDYAEAIQILADSKGYGSNENSE